MSLVVFKSLMIAWHTFEAIWLLSRYEWSRRLLDCVLATAFVVSMLVAVLIPLLWWAAALLLLLFA